MFVRKLLKGLKMAHEIEIIDGKAQMAYVGETPWHGLGTKLPQGVSPEQMMKASGLDWEVEKRPNFINTKNGTKRTGTFSLVRATDEKVLTQVGPDWNPVQNKQAFDFFHEFCQAGSMDMHTAGSLRDGKYVWALAKVGSDFELFNGDKVEGYLLFSNPHQFGRSIDVKFTPIRVVCNNTLTLSLNTTSENQVRLTHRGHFDPEMVKNTLGIASQQMEDYRTTAELLGSKQMTDKKFKDFLGKVFGEKNNEGLTKTGRLAYDMLEQQPGAEFARGSWWQGLNAATYVMDHMQGRSVDTRLANVWFGLGRNKKIKAFQTAVEMATA
jgi:phage/plasmid-like protein (TIGR03299 family)